MFCIKCGTQLPDIANFCYNCGLQLKDSENISLNNSSLKLGNEEILFKSTGSVANQGAIAKGNIIITNKNLKFERNQAISTINIRTSSYAEYIDSFHIPLNEISALTRNCRAEEFMVTSNNKSFLYTVEDIKHDFPMKLYELIKNNNIFKENLPKDYHFAPRELVNYSSQATIVKSTSPNEAVKMILTDKRIVFLNNVSLVNVSNGKYGAFSYNKYKYEIPLEEIDNVNFKLENMNSPLVISLGDDTIYKFLVPKNELWKNEINKAIENLKKRG